MLNPVLVDVIRGDAVESCHRGSIVVVNRHGEVVYQLGDIERSIYPRSALKFFQALPLLESGAADAFSLTPAQIALACASHSGQPQHTGAVHSWLAAIGLQESDLENGPDYPLDKTARRELYAKTAPATRFHHNCSGKHAGMLTLTRHLKAATQGYSRHRHVSQRVWMEALSELAGLDVAELPWERDGCGLPAVQMPILSLALASARYADTAGLPGQRKSAIKRILQSISGNPKMVAGDNRCCTEVIAVSCAKVFVKTGAEAVYIAILPKAGLGVALKIDDGNSRASEVALGAVLTRLGVLTKTQTRQLDRWFSPRIQNSQGHLTGVIRPGESWLD